MNFLTDTTEEQKDWEMVTGAYKVSKAKVLHYYIW